MPDVVAITRIRHGLEDGSIVEIEPGDSLTVGEKTEDKDGKPVYSETQIREYIAMGAAFDKSGELNDVLPAGLDVDTLKRDAMLLEAGQPVHVDTSNPLESAQKHIMQDQPQSLERKTVADNIKVSDQVETPAVLKAEEKAEKDLAEAQAKVQQVQAEASKTKASSTTAANTAGTSEKK